MASQVPPGQDPLVAALPPETDYITYLTLLEYNLNPQNLPTLNSLLSADDGTLAAEIGWDLLKLVLPMLKDVPDAAQDCLDIVARRGNPREVVVRVAEELERLGEDENEDEDEEAPHDQPPTAFKGEAPQVHLGSMALDGMPQPQQPSKIPREADIVSEKAGAHLDGMKLACLLSMMSNLHPRIQTQYPSRFLATSLPAALRAYRTLEITPTTTSSFIGFLSKLSGKKRPPLPPRTSTAGSISTKSEPRSPEISTAQASLPDPESSKDPSAAEKKPSENEKAVVQRLLQAVLLEVFDEYTASFAATDVSSMQWTTKLRAKREPGSMPSYRTEELGLWSTDPQLSERETIVSKLVKLGSDLSLDVVNEIKILGDSKRRHSFNDAEEEAAPEVNEYPSSPAEIPFSTTGLVLLFAAQNFAANYTSQVSTSRKGPLAIDPAYLFSHLRTSNPAPSASATDAILSLLYLDALRLSNTDQSILIHALKLLQDTFITSSDSVTRDNAHYIATLLLHCRCDRPSRLTVITDILAARKQSTIVEGPLHEIQAGNVKAIAIEWLKDEIYPSERARLIQDRYITDEVPRGTPASVLANSNTDDSGLAARVFPAVQPPPSTGSEPDTEHLETFLLHVPFYVSSLNLLSILAKQEHSNVSMKAVLNRGEVMLVTLEKWRDVLVNIATLAAERSGSADIMNVADIYALEDAVGRAREAVDEP